MEHRDGCRDELLPEAEAPDLLRADARRQALTVWDAWADVRRDAKEDGPLAPLAPQPAACVEKWAGPARGDPVLDDLRLQWEPQAARSGQLDEPAPYRPDAAQFAGQSCAALESAERPGVQAQLAQGLQVRHYWQLAEM